MISNQQLNLTGPTGVLPGKASEDSRSRLTVSGGHYTNTINGYIYIFIILWQHLFSNELFI